ncbi:MAG: magnesium transporter [Pirellulaceae bacterium]
MINTLYLPEIREMLQTQNGAELKEFCEALHPAATADFMEGLTADETWGVLVHASPETQSEIFNYFDHGKQLEIITTQDRTAISRLLVSFALDDRVDLLNELSPELSQELLDLMPVEERRETQRIQAYEEGTAGAVMTTEVAKLSESISVREAFVQLQQQSHELETIYYIYVVDDSDHLRGVLSARDLISALARPDRLLSEIMETEPITVDVSDDQEEVLKKVAYYDLLAIPVVDPQHRMLGIITHDDVIDVALEEATEDAHKIAGVAPLENSYLRTGLMSLCWRRAVWLAPLFFAAMLTAKAIKIFEEPLEATPWLYLFLPLVISSGGNSGNQSATLVITGLTKGDIGPLDWLRVVGREFAMGLMLGTILALVYLPVARLIEPTIDSWQALSVVPATLLLVVCCGTLFGSILPLVFHRMGQDPALMSNPFVAGIIDIVGIVVYVGVAMLLLGSG